jgi:hypothetical protein
MFLPAFALAARPDDLPGTTPGTPEAEPGSRSPVEPEIDVPSEPEVERLEVHPLGSPPQEPHTSLSPIPPVPPMDRMDPPMDRMDHNDEPPPSRRPRVWPLALAIGAVVTVIALVVTFAFLRNREESDVPDILGLAAERAALAPIALRTSNAEEAGAYIFDQFGWPLMVPDLHAARLIGVGIDPLAEGVELPVLHYRTEDGASVTVYTYDYAFLDAAERQVRLAPAVYSHLADPEMLDVRRQDDRYLVIWRRRAAIYTAVTANSDAARALQEEVRVTG